MAKNINIHQTSKTRIGSRNLQTSSFEVSPVGRGKKSFRAVASSLSPTTSGSMRRSESVTPKIRFDSKYYARNSSISKNPSVLRNESNPRRGAISRSGVVESDKTVNCKRALCPPTCTSRSRIPSQTSIISGGQSTYRSSCCVGHATRNSQEFPIVSSAPTNVNRTCGINRSYESHGFPGSCGALTGCTNSQVLTNIDARRSCVGSLNSQPYFSNELLSGRRTNDASTSTAYLPFIPFSVPQSPRTSSHNTGMCPCRLGPDGRRSPQTLGMASGPMPTRSIEDGNLYGGNSLLGAIEMLGAASVLVHRKMLAGSVLVAPPGFSSPSTTGFGALPETTGNSTGQGLGNTSGYNPRREAPPIYGGTGNDNSMEDSVIHVEKYTPDNKIKKKNKMKKKSDILSPILSLDNTAVNKPTRSHGASALSDKTPISSEEISVVAQPQSETPLDANVSETFDGVNKTDTQIKNKPVESILKKTVKKKMEPPNLTLDNTILNKPIKSQKTSPSIRHKTVNIGEKNPIVAKPEVQMKDDANIAQTLDDVTEIQNTLKIPGDNEFSKDIGTSDNTKSLDIGKSPEYQEGTKTIEDPAINSRCTKMTICADIPRRSCISGTNGLFVMAEVSQSPTTSKTTGTFIVSGDHTLNRQSEYCSNRGIKNVCPTAKICKVTQPKESFYTSKSKTSRIHGERRDTESSKSIIMPNSLEIQSDETLDNSQNRRENASSIISDDTTEEQETSEASAKNKLSKVIQNLEKAETQSVCGSTGLTVIIRGTGNARVSVTSECSDIPKNLRAKDAFERASAAGMPSLSEESASVRSSRRNDDFCQRNRCSMIPELPGKPTEFKIHELNEMPISVCSQADSTLNNIKLPDATRINEIKGYTDENNIFSMSEALFLSRDDKRCSSIGVARTSQMKKGNGKRTTIDARISEEQIEKSAPLGIFETMKTVCETERIRSHGLELKAGGRNQTCTRAVRGGKSQTNKKRSFKTPSSAPRHTVGHCGTAIISGVCNPHTNVRVGNAFGMLEAAGNARYGTCFEGVARQLIETRHRSQRATRRRPNTRRFRTQGKNVDTAAKTQDTTSAAPPPPVIAHVERSISSEIMAQNLNSDSD